MFFTTLQLFPRGLIRSAEAAEIGCQHSGMRLLSIRIQFLPPFPFHISAREMTKLLTKRSNEPELFINLSLLENIIDSSP